MQELLDRHLMNPPDSSNTIVRSAFNWTKTLDHEETPAQRLYQIQL